MTRDGEGFSPRPRVDGDTRQATDRANVLDELERIAVRLTDRVVGTSRAEFFDGSPSYDAASMVVVRLYGLLERADSDELRAVLSADEVAALRTIRNIVAHGGYATMNDESFWITSTRELPEIVARLRATAEATHPEPSSNRSRE